MSKFINEEAAPSAAQKRFAVAGIKKWIWHIAQARATQIVGAGCGGAFFLLQLLVCALLILGYNEIRKKSDRTSYVLHSSAPFHAVHIPFDLYDDAIILSGELSGRKMKCQFDTGCSPILWDKKLHLVGEKTSRTNTVWDMAGKKSSMEEYILPSLRFGSYEVRRQSTWVMKPKIDSRSKIDGSVRDHPMVGNEVFRDVVVTIDYHTKELIVRSPDYDVTHEPIKKNAHIISFTRTSTGGGLLYGLPCIGAQINDVAARVVLDTGWTRGVWMDSAFAKNVAPRAKQKRKTVSDLPTDDEGNPMEIYTIQVNLEKKGKAISNIPATVFPHVKPNNEFDMMAGHDVLRFFRITIDYPRQKILLEPFDEKIIQIVPKGKFVTIEEKGRTVFKKRYESDVTVFRYADGTTVITRYQQIVK